MLGSVVNTASCVEGNSVNLPTTAAAVDGYTFAGWVKSAINDKIDMIYTAKVPDSYTNPYVVFSFHGENTTVTEYETDENGNIKFVFTEITPQCMGDDITATLYASKAGTPESVSVEDYSVRNFH